MALRAGLHIAARPRSKRVTESGTPVQCTPSLDVTIEKEVYPLDTLSFPAVTTQTFKDNIKGYNAGADLTWRFSKYIGVGMVIRYSNGKENFTPTGGAPFTVEVGGLHAGGGLRLIL